MCSVCVLILMLLWTCPHTLGTDDLDALTPDKDIYVLYMCPRTHTTIYYCTRVHILQGTEDLDALTPDKDLYDVIHTSTRPLPPYSTHPTDSTDSKDLAADVQAAEVEEEAAAAAQHAWSPGMSAEEEEKKKRRCWRERCG